MAQNLYSRRASGSSGSRSTAGSTARSTGFRDRRAAERRAIELELEIRKQGLGWTPKPVVTFKQWAERYVRTYSSGSGRHGGTARSSLTSHPCGIRGPSDLPAFFGPIFLENSASSERWLTT